MNFEMSIEHKELTINIPLASPFFELLSAPLEFMIVMSESFQIEQNIEIGIRSRENSYLWLNAFEHSEGYSFQRVWIQMLDSVTKINTNMRSYVTPNPRTVAEYRTYSSIHITASTSTNRESGSAMLPTNKSTVKLRL